MVRSSFIDRQAPTVHPPVTLKPIGTSDPDRVTDEPTPDDLEQLARSVAMSGRHPSGGRSGPSAPRPPGDAASREGPAHGRRPDGDLPGDLDDREPIVDVPLAQPHRVDPARASSVRVGSAADHHRLAGRLSPSRRTAREIVSAETPASPAMTAIEARSTSKRSRSQSASMSTGGRFGARSRSPWRIRSRLTVSSAAPSSSAMAALTSQRPRSAPAATPRRRVRAPVAHHPRAGSRCRADASRSSQQRSRLLQHERLTRRSLRRRTHPGAPRRSAQGVRAPARSRACRAPRAPRRDRAWTAT